MRPPVRATGSAASRPSGSPVNLPAETWSFCPDDDVHVASYPEVMNAVLRLASDGRGASANVLVRVLVGAVFLSEGIQKFLFAEALGVGRFAKIGIPFPQFSAPFVGIVEIVAGTLLLVGLLTRVAALLLLIDISVAIATTKIPMLLSKGFWAAVHEGRTDWAMFVGLVFVLVAGAGPRSLDARLSQRAP
jgi:putative oxidoreductase